MADITIEIVENDVTFNIIESEMTIEFPVSLVGPAGQDGADAPGTTQTWEAGENLSAGRGVLILGGVALYFQPNNTAHRGLLYGITTTSATAGNDVNIQLLGEVTDPAFSFSTGSMIWVGSDGELFEAVQSGTIQKAGIAVAADKIKIDFSIQIVTI
jgi:hypothetical protein